MLSDCRFEQPNQLDTAPQGDVPCWALEPYASSEGGYRMIQSIKIRNFRCFADADVQDLKTVNLLVGNNASGKTAFLEALYFTLGSPALAFKLRVWRGLGSAVQYTEYVESRNAVWRDLFYKFDQNLVVRITFKGTPDVARSVKITAGRQESQLVSTKKGQPLIRRIPPIVFEYYHAGSHIATVRPSFSGEGITFENPPEPLHGSFFPSALPIDPLETAAHFSNLSKQGKEEPVVKALHDLFPMVKSLSLEMTNSVPMVHASIKGITEKVPLGLLSTGVTKVLAYLVAIANQPGGIVIADEIENGFYYDSMKEIWGVLRSFCVDHGVQLFASTHSAECLDALESTLSEHQEDFSLLRTVREEDGCVIRHFQGKQLLAALKEDIEVR